MLASCSDDDCSQDVHAANTLTNMRQTDEDAQTTKDQGETGEHAEAVGLTSKPDTGSGVSKLQRYVVLGCGASSCVVLHGRNSACTITQVIAWQSMSDKAMQQLI